MNFLLKRFRKSHYSWVTINETQWSEKWLLFEMKKKYICNVYTIYLGRASTYSPSTKICHFLNLEKTLILLSEEETSLNQRSELMSKCRHKAKHLLCKYWYCKLVDFFSIYVVFGLNCYFQKSTTFKAKNYAILLFISLSTTEERYARNIMFC